MLGGHYLVLKVTTSPSAVGVDLVWSTPYTAALPLVSRQGHPECFRPQSQRKSQTASKPATTAYAAITRRLEVSGTLPAQLSERAWTAAPVGV